MQMTDIIAQRGLSRLFPENTLVSMKAANKVGAGWVSADVQVLKDGMPVIIRDDDISRVTDRQGLLREMVEEDVVGLDVGSWFDERFSKERIPLLSDLLYIVDELNLGLSLEIRYNKDYHKALSKKEISSIVHSIMRVLTISPKPPRGLIIVSGFLPFLKEVREINRDIHIGYRVDVLEDDYIEQAKSVDANSIYLAKEILFDMDATEVQNTLDNIKNNDMNVYVYTISNLKEGKSLIDSNIKGILTDYPQDFTRYLP